MPTKFWSENLKGRPGHIWKDVRMDLQEIGCKGVDWMHLAQNRVQWQGLVNTLINFQAP
jgi:hypothetical protein